MLATSPLQQAINEIRSAPRSGAPTYSRVVGASAVARIDAFLDELEELHLHGGVRVPSPTVDRLSMFLEALPREWPTKFPLRTRIAYVIEDLFTVQEYALDLKLRGLGMVSSLGEGSEWEGRSDSLRARGAGRRRSPRPGRLG